MSREAGGHFRYNEVFELYFSLFQRRSGHADKLRLRLNFTAVAIYYPLGYFNAWR